MSYANRYRAAIARARQGFTASDAASFDVVERLQGDSSTDFGAPGAVPAADRRPLDQAEIKRQIRLLRACWGAFDQAVRAAAGVALRTGPRGGGRNLNGIVDHVIGGDAGYLNALGWKHRWNEGTDRIGELARTRKGILDGLEASVRGEIPRIGPRGGIRWPARYFVRRAAWHTLDHAWEIEDRASPA